jgi:O-antigen/teichoic acid export membrane protein
MSGQLPDNKGRVAAFFSVWGLDLSLQWISTIYIAGISFGMSVVLARVLGVEGFGTYSYLLSLAGIYMILQDGGYKTVLFRDRVVDSSNYLLRFGIGHLIFTTLLGGIVVVLLQPQEWQALLAALFCMGLVVLTDFVSSGLKGEGNFRLDAIWKGVVRTATAVAILGIVFFHPSDALSRIFLGWGLALLLVLLWPLIKKRLLWPQFRLRADLLKANIAFLTIDLATILYFRSDIVLLKHFGHDPQDVGQYAAAYRVLEGVILLATPTALIAFRALRVRWMEQSDDFLRLLLTLVFAMLLMAVVILIVGAIWGPELIVLAFGQQYAIAGALLFWLLLSVLFILPNYILTQGAIAMDREKSYACAAVGAALVNIILNLFWIPKYGAVGAAWATVAAEGVLCLSLSCIFWHTWKKVTS